MKRLPPKKLLEVFRDVVEEAARIHGPNGKKTSKTKRLAKTVPVSKPSRKIRAAAE